MLLRKIMYFTKSLMSCVHGGRGLCRDRDAHSREVERVGVPWPPQHLSVFSFLLLSRSKLVRNTAAVSCVVDERFSRIEY